MPWLKYLFVSKKILTGSNMIYNHIKWTKLIYKFTLTPPGVPSLPTNEQIAHQESLLFLIENSRSLARVPWFSISYLKVSRLGTRRKKKNILFQNIHSTFINLFTGQITDFLICVNKRGYACHTVKFHHCLKMVWTFFGVKYSSLLAGAEQVSPKRKTKFL